jgi:hypothetical protein
MRRGVKKQRVEKRKERILYSVGLCVPPCWVLHVLGNNMQNLPLLCFWLRMGPELDVRGCYVAGTCT